ncbi:MAG: permease-like cell division protein FtsX [Sulfurimicrobium sp.]|nr:permease-like cell division protein FtsX [Sulfurimicrobium sp.]MDP2961829.1 permease-like cell division protein FtsX [Sulfurimicrobium sp.]
MSRHWRTLKVAMGRLAGTPLATLVTILVIGIALSLPAGLYLLLSNLAQASSAFETQPQISLFLRLDAGKEAQSQIEKKLKSHAAVKSFRFVGRDQALMALSASNGLGDLAAGLPDNPLPDTYILSARDSEATQLDKLRLEVSKWPGVEAADLDSAWVRRLNAMLDLGRQLTFMLAALLGFGLVAGMGNIIRLQILTRQEEIEVSKLIGATDRFIRLPFLYHGALQGLLGGLAAWAIIAVSAQLLNFSVASLAALYGSSFRLDGLYLSDAAALLGFSTILGWVGAYLAVSHFLRHFKLTHH